MQIDELDNYVQLHLYIRMHMNVMCPNLCMLHKNIPTYKLLVAV